MTTQYTPTLKLALPVTGELSGTWGDVVNDNITSMIEQAIAGLSTINTWTANAHTLTTANGTTSESRCAMLVAATGGGAPTAAAEIICPAAAKLYVLQNNTSYAVTLKTSAGTGVAVAAGDTAFLFCDGTNVNSCVTTIVDGNITGNLTVGGNATINGNTTLGNATSDTITATARFASDLVPSTDNARDLGSAANSWRSLWIDGTATMALVAITGGTIDGVSIGSTTAATIINVDNLRLDGNTISSTDTNGNVVIAPNGTGDVQLDADTVRVGDAAAAATLTSNGAGALTVTTGGAADLTLSTNAGVNSGTVVIANGVNGNITLTPNGTGDVILSADRVQMGDSNTDTTLTTNGTGNLNLTTNDGTNSGTIQIAQGINGNITLTPNGTGSVSISKLYSSGNTTLGATSANTLSVAALVNSNLLFTDATYDIGATGANRPRDLFLSRNLTVGGTLTLTGGVNLNGNVTVGDASTDTLTINSTITSNLIFTDNTYDIGASGATRPRTLYLGTSLITPAITNSGLTSGRITYAGTGGLLQDSANLTFNGSTLAITGAMTATGRSGVTMSGQTSAVSLGQVSTDTTYGLLSFNGAYASTTLSGMWGGGGSNDLLINVPTGGAIYSRVNNSNVTILSSTGLAVTGTFSSTLGATIQGLTVGLGAGAVASNTAVGASALFSNTTNGQNTALGYNAGYYSTGSANTYVGHNAGPTVTASASGSYNTSLGAFALQANTTASDNTAVGYQAGYSNKTGTQNAYFGKGAGYTGITATGNSVLGFNALYFNTGDQNTAIGRSALESNTTASNNTAVGFQAGYTNQSGTVNTYMGYQAGFYQTNSYNTAIGASSMYGASGTSTGQQNTAVGRTSLYANTSGSYNTAVGHDSLVSNTVSSSNTAVGFEAGKGNVNGNGNVFVGYQAGYASNYPTNGQIANTFIGYQSGVSVTTGYKNVIIGSYSGLGAPISQTGSNYIVLSDGDGNVRFVNNSSGTDSFLPGTSPLYVTSDTFQSNLHIGNNVALMSYGVAGNRQFQLASNLYYYNGGYRYKTSNGASKLAIGTLGGWDFAGAVAGTADAVAATVATLGTDGNGYTVYLQGGAVSQTGTGITFPATQNASTNANTLDDYEEGTWTPVVGGTATYFSQAGTYVKIGRFVYVDFLLRINNIGTGSSTIMTGLPFVAGSGQSPRSSGSIAYAAALATSVYSLSVNADGNGIQFEAFTSLATGTVDNVAVWGNSAYIIGSATYYTSA
jgi:hypothetical protein